MVGSADGGGVRPVPSRGGHDIRDRTAPSPLFAGMLHHSGDGPETANSPGDLGSCQVNRLRDEPVQMIRADSESTQASSDRGNRAKRPHFPAFWALPRPGSGLGTAFDIASRAICGRPRDKPFKKGNPSQAPAQFRDLIEADDGDDRVWCHAAVANGLSSKNWAAGDTVAFVRKGIEREKAGPPAAKIHAAFGELPRGSARIGLPATAGRPEPDRPAGDMLGGLNLEFPKNRGIVSGNSGRRKLRPAPSPAGFTRISPGSPSDPVAWEGRNPRPFQHPHPAPRI